MINLHLLRNKSVGIFGLGKTGISCVNACMPYVGRLICYDDKLDTRVKFSHQDLLVSYADNAWTELDYIIVSPGIPRSHIIFKLKIPIISDIDLLYIHNPAKYYICITGTNGKSTTTALIGHILSSNGVKCGVGGNIGIPVLELSDDYDVFVLELSSFQLELIRNVKPQIGVLLNVSEDHLDRYESIKEYLHVKMKLINICDQAVIGVDDQYTKVCYEQAQKNNITPISSKHVLNSGVSVIENQIYVNLQEQAILSLQYNKFLQGLHNKQNIAAAFVACSIFGLSNEQIIHGISSFIGLPHRMQFIHENRGLYFYNDSKATNPEAASKSISALQNIYLLAGGIAKTDDITPILPYISHIKKAYLYGIDKIILHEAFKNYVSTEIFNTLEQALKAAIKDAVQDHSEQKNILLAPLCSSLDQFKNFEERGDVFTQLTKNYLD